MSLRTVALRLGLSGQGVDITRGRLRDNIWQLSWPMSVSQALFMLPNLYDAYWLGKLGPHALAAAGLAMSVRVTMISVLMALSAAAGAVIARYVGARNRELANLATLQAVILFIVASGSLGVIGFAFAPTLLQWAGAKGDLLPPTLAYARVIFAGLIAMEMVPSMGYMLSSAGSPQLSLAMNLLMLVSFLVLEPLLIGLGLDVTGAALALVLANSLAMLFGLFLLITGRAPVCIDRHQLRIDLDLMWRILRIAGPAVIQRGMPNLANTILMRFMALYGAAALAAFQVINRVTMLLLIPCSGMGRVAPALVGQNLGAQQPERAERAVKWIALAASALGLLILGGFVLASEPVLRVFTQDANTLAVARHGLLILVAYQFFLMLSTVMDGGLTGAGDTVSPMVINILVLWLIQLPGVWLLSRALGWGIDGVWWAMAGSMALQWVAMTIRFWQGRWKHVQI